jgi:hypothetical protein
MKSDWLKTKMFLVNQTSVKFFSAIVRRKHNVILDDEGPLSFGLKNLMFCPFNSWEKTLLENYPLHGEISSAQTSSNHLAIPIPQARRPLLKLCTHRYVSKVAFP